MSSDQSREKILEAAGPVFAEFGFEKATVREICRRAGTNVASINYHFGSKDHLYRELIRNIHIANDADPLPVWSNDTPAAARLRDFTRHMLESTSKKDRNSWQFKLMFQEMVNPTGVLSEIVSDFVRPHFAMLLQILDDLVPPDVPLGVRQRLGFTVISHCAFYHLHSAVVGLLVSSDDLESHFGLDQLSDYITSVTLAAAASLQPAVTPSRTGAPLRTGTFVN